MALSAVSAQEPAVQELLVELLQTPLTGAGGIAAVQETLVPPLCPLQFQRYWVEVSAVSAEVPAIQALLVVPQEPLTGLFN